MHCPRLWVFTPHDVQHTMGMVHICTLTIWTHLLPGHLPIDDGSAPHLLWRSHRYCWWHCCTWQLHKLMRVVWEHRLVFNREKCNVKASSVTFFGTGYDKNGAHPDPKKVEAIQTMPPLAEPQELQRFLGMTMYMSPFIPSLSTLTAPLWELLKKGTEFTWNTTYQEAFDSIKNKVCMDTTLRFFNAEKVVTIQVDASQKGLGTALLQDGCPITFTSKRPSHWLSNSMPT